MLKKALDDKEISQNDYERAISYWNDTETENAKERLPRFTKNLSTKYGPRKAKLLIDILMSEKIITNQQQQQQSNQSQQKVQRDQYHAQQSPKQTINKQMQKNVQTQQQVQQPQHQYSQQQQLQNLQIQQQQFQQLQSQSMHQQQYHLQQQHLTQPQNNILGAQPLLSNSRSLNPQQSILYQQPYNNQTQVVQQYSQANYLNGQMQQGSMQQNITPSNAMLISQGSNNVNLVNPNQNMIPLSSSFVPPNGSIQNNGMSSNGLSHNHNLSTSLTSQNNYIQSNVTLPNSSLPLQHNAMMSSSSVSNQNHFSNNVTNSMKTVNHLPVIPAPANINLAPVSNTVNDNNDSNNTLKRPFHIHNQSVPENGVKSKKQRKNDNYSVPSEINHFSQQINNSSTTNILNKSVEGFEELERPTYFDPHNNTIDLNDISKESDILKQSLRTGITSSYSHEDINNAWKDWKYSHIMDYDTISQCAQTVLPSTGVTIDENTMFLLSKTIQAYAKHVLELNVINHRRKSCKGDAATYRHISHLINNEDNHDYDHIAMKFGPDVKTSMISNNNEKVNKYNSSLKSYDEYYKNEMTEYEEKLKLSKKRGGMTVTNSTDEPTWLNDEIDEKEGNLSWEELALSHMRGKVAKKYDISVHPINKKSNRSIVSRSIDKYDEIDNTMLHSVVSNESNNYPFEQSTDEITLDDMTTVLSKITVPRGGGPYSQAIGKSLKKVKLGLKSQ